MPEICTILTGRWGRRSFTKRRSPAGLRPLSYTAVVLGDESFAGMLLARMAAQGDPPQGVCFPRIRMNALTLKPATFLLTPPGRVQRALCLGPAPHRVVVAFAHSGWKRSPLVLAGTRFTVQDPFAHCLLCLLSLIFGASLHRLGVKTLFPQQTTEKGPEGSSVEHHVMSL